MKKWELSLVLPAYNEETGIRQAIAEADEALSKITNAYEVLVVDDGSKDGTATVVEETIRQYPNARLFRHPKNRGYGASLRTGFEAARFDRIAFTDADCQFNLADLQLLLDLTEEADIAAGWRIDRKDIWKRRFFSWGYNQLTGLLLGTHLRDVDCALKVFRRDALMTILPESQHFFVNTEMITRARHSGLNITETGVQHRPRNSGVSKVSPWDIPKTLAHLLPFWWSMVVVTNPTTWLPGLGKFPSKNSPAVPRSTQ